MSTFRTILSHAVALTLVVVTAHASGLPEESKPPVTGSRLPGSFIDAFPEFERFRDEGYSRLMAGDALRAADVKALFERMTAASRKGEIYKALYLARLFTHAKPELAAGWSNRAELAAAVGFSQEAAASHANVQAGGHLSIPPAALPGAIKVRPTTLADWAAALALVSDDVAAKEGPHRIVAVRDDLSGHEVPSAEEIQRCERGPWATAKPVQISVVLPNLFVMPQATPMDKKSMKGGLFALGALALAGSTFASTVGAADAAAAFSEMYGDAMAKAFEVPSELKGGSFVSTTFSGDVAKATTTTPRTSGKHEAIGTPLSMLWASGGSMSPTLQARWKSGDSSKSETMRIDAKTKKREWKKQEVPQLFYPRVHQLCAGSKDCSPRLMLLEVLLTAEDVAALAPGNEQRLPAIGAWHARYTSHEGMTVIAAGETYAGFDASGVIYVTRQRPTEWLTPVAPVNTAQK